MDQDLAIIHRRVMEAGTPEEVFGAEDVVLPASTLLGFLRSEYEKLKVTTNPASYTFPDDRELAEEADAGLERMYVQARRRIEAGWYGMPGHGRSRPGYAVKSFPVGANRYFIGRELDDDGQTVRYEGFLERDGKPLGEVEIVVAKTADHNLYVQNSLRNLDTLHGEEVPQWKHLPLVLDRFQSGGRVGLVLRKISGFTLDDVRAHPRHVKGIDQRHMIWMLDRLLSCLGYVHRRGIVHTALSPSNIVIQPANHNVVLRGWESAILNPAMSGERAKKSDTLFTPPEIREGGPVGPWSDIYSLGMVMIWMLGGDPEKLTLPTGVEPKIGDFLRRMVQGDPYRRPVDAWALYDEENRIKDALWPRRFLHFDMSD